MHSKLRPWGSGVLSSGKVSQLLPQQPTGIFDAQEHLSRPRSSILFMYTASVHRAAKDLQMNPQGATKFASQDGKPAEGIRVATNMSFLYNLKLFSLEPDMKPMIAKSCS